MAACSAQAAGEAELARGARRTSWKRPVTGSTTTMVQQLPHVVSRSRMTHTARSLRSEKSSGNSLEISPKATVMPQMKPHVVQVYVASSDEIESGS